MSEGFLSGNMLNVDSTGAEEELNRIGRIQINHLIAQRGMGSVNAGFDEVYIVEERIDSILSKPLNY